MSDNGTFIHVYSRLKHGGVRFVHDKSVFYYVFTELKRIFVIFDEQ